MEKVIIYLRTSTKDQEPELQRNQCLEFSKDKGLEVIEVASEQGSAYNLEKIRPIWESVVKKAKNENLSIILWKYDRAFRNRKEFYKFMKVMFEVYKVKIYSVTEPSILSFWELIDKSHSDNPIFNELLSSLFKALWDFMIQNAGEIAEEESRKKSERVRLAVRKEGNITKSYKGNKWGRKSLNKRIIDEIIELRNQGLTIHGIRHKINYYDKNNNKKLLSLGAIHKVIKDNRLNE